MNSHVRFVEVDFDLSDFSNSVEDLGEDQVNKALLKLKGEAREKNVGWGKNTSFGFFKSCSHVGDGQGG